MRCTLDLFTQTDGLTVQSHSRQKKLFFFSPSSAWDLISPFSLSPQILFLFWPGLRVTGLSGQADASLSVQSEAGPGSSPSCPDVYLTVCLSGPAVAPASHLCVKSSSGMEHFKSARIRSWTKTREPTSSPQWPLNHPTPSQIFSFCFPSSQSGEGKSFSRVSRDDILPELWLVCRIPFNGNTFK